MNKLFLNLIISFVTAFTANFFITYFFANFSLAYSQSCDDKNSTVVYINGIFTSQRSAQQDLMKLNYEYNLKNQKNNVNFINGYNESHFIGAGDLVKSAMQAYEGGGLDYDLTNILGQVHSELQTRKVLLVGHSQGTFYTNATYEYLIKNGSPEESTAVYNIATPADRVAGNGNYFTSSTDRVINYIVRQMTNLGSAKKPLSSNITIPLSQAESKKEFGGHSFSDVYLSGASDEIIGAIKNKINDLSTKNQILSLSTDGCFVPPEAGPVYKLKKAVFAIGDGVSKDLSYIVNGSVDLSKKFYRGFSYAYDSGRKLMSNFFGVLAKTKIFGAALTLRSNQDKSSPEQNNPSPEPSIGTAKEVERQKFGEQVSGRNEAFIIPPIVNNNQELIDDLLERIDLLKSQLASLQAAENLKNQTQSFNQNQIQNQTVSVSRIPSPNQNNVLYSNYLNGGITGGTVYPQILISEVQIAGSSDEKEEFVELHNPNSREVSLTGWYIHRKTKTGSAYSTYASNTLFEGKNISAKGYLLVARSLYFTKVADIFVDNPLTDDNSLILKNPNGDIIDKVGWGQAQDFENMPTQGPGIGQSIGRKMGFDQEQDSDNNSSDFEINTPTPRAQNIAYVSSSSSPSPPPSPSPSSPADTVAPQVFFNLNLNQSSLNFPINFTIEDPLGVVSPSGVALYIFRWQEELAVWQEDNYQTVSGGPSNYAGSKDFSGSDEKNYYFQIKAKDVAGNESNWLPETPATAKISLPKKVLINEIQIDSKIGGGGNDDDWVELHNPNNLAVSLKGWSIQKHGVDTPCSLNKSFYKKDFDNNHAVPAKGFFLIADTKAEKSLKDIADMTIGWSLSDNSTVYLVRSQDKISDGNSANIVDKVGFGNKACFPEISPAVAPPEAKSIERKKLGLDTDNNENDFKISDQSTPKDTFPKVTLEDITDYSLKPGSNSPGAPVYNLLLKWQSPSQNIDFYQVQYKLNSGEWTDWFTKTVQTKDYFKGVYSLFNDNTYYFKARAHDKDGNLGSWSPEIKIDLAIPVVINEVAFAGTNASPDDQWLELYNRTSQDIDLTDWKIVSGSDGKDTLNLALSGVILAKGRFILERDNNKTLSDILANQIFKDKIGKNYLYLRAPNNRYVDEFYVPLDGLKKNSFIKDDNHHSIERVSPYAFGSLDKNWQINNGKTINGQDKKKDQVYGTPGQKNSIDQLYTYYPFSFIQDTTLKKELSPYLFNGDVEVFLDVILSVEPGAVLKFYDNQSKLAVKGTLKAVGKDIDKIIFTSFKDDNYGGDSNGDGSLSMPVPGDWLSLYFSKDSKNSELEQVTVRYGGAVLGFSPLGWGNAVFVDHSSISLKNSLIEKNKNRGLMMTNSNSVIDSVKFLEQNTTDWPSGQNEAKAIYVKGGQPSIKNSHFENNSTGIYINYYSDGVNNIEAWPIVQNNNFVKNGDPIYLGPLSYPTFLNNQASDNSYNAIVFASDISKNMTLKPDLPYLIKDLMTVPENIILTLDPGVVMAFKDNWAGLKIDGTLKALGAQNQPIVFRPYYDGVGPGNWLGLGFTKSSKNSEMDQIAVSYGGAFYGNSQNKDFTAAIKVNQSSIALKNSVFSKNANNGLWLVNSPSTIDAIKFLDHAVLTVVLDPKAIYVEGGSPAIKNSSFKGNYYGIYIDKWHDPDANENVPGAPILENNKFEGSVKADIYYVP